MLSLFHWLCHFLQELFERELLTTGEAKELRVLFLNQVDLLRFESAATLTFLLYICSCQTNILCILSIKSSRIQVLSTLQCVSELVPL